MNKIADKQSEIGILNDSSEAAFIRLVHEVSSTLTAAKLNLELYKQDLDRNYLRNLDQNLKLITEYINQAKRDIKDEDYKQSFSVSTVIQKVLNNFASQIEVLGATIRLIQISEEKIYGNQTKFIQLVSIVIKNALDEYIKSNNLLRIIDLEISRSDDYVLVSIKDYGPGIDNSSIEKIFEPFYSTKEHSIHNLGLGLSLVKTSIKDDFAGKVEVESRLNIGTVFRLYFRAN